MFGTTRTLSGSGHPSKLDARARSKLLIGAIKRPMATVKELQDFKAKIGNCVHGTTILQVLHKCGLFGRVIRMHLEDSDVENAVMVNLASIPNGMPEIQCSSKSTIHHTYSKAWGWEHPVVQVRLCSKAWGSRQGRRKNGWGKSNS